MEEVKGGGRKNPQSPEIERGRKIASKAEKRKGVSQRKKRERVKMRGF